MKICVIIWVFTNYLWKTGSWKRDIYFFCWVDMIKLLRKMSYSKCVNFNFPTYCLCVHPCLLFVLSQEVVQPAMTTDVQKCRQYMDRMTPFCIREVTPWKTSQVVPPPLHHLLRVGDALCVLLIPELWSSFAQTAGKQLGHSTGRLMASDW